MMEDMAWRKSSRSNANGENCVELARMAGVVAVRDSKDHGGPQHRFSGAAMAVFFAAVKRGRYDLD